MTSVGLGNLTQRLAIARNPDGTPFSHFPRSPHLLPPFFFFFKDLFMGNGGGHVRSGCLGVPLTRRAVPSSVTSPFRLAPAVMTQDGVLRLFHRPGTSRRFVEGAARPASAVVAPHRA